MPKRNVTLTFKAFIPFEAFSYMINMQKFLKYARIFQLDGYITKTLGGTFVAEKCMLSTHFLTVMYGADAVSPNALIFLIDSEQNAVRWLNEIRRLSVKALKELSLQGCFYYWQRLFTKIRYSTNTDQVSINEFAFICSQIS
ncbi:hypothetical protein WUBG_10635 [Wuchereria bancrofti]|uniref:PH domain-containing protein n=1 Tax=Wuchereria bancrofti TaxID=6293 RepID=J9EN34_WUCBA|nr:hypothetical protein WUBG_10635 [Wuchereria bancrofti]